MKNGKEWESFRITLLLYVIVMLIPLTFYFVYSSFNSSRDDTKVIHHAGWIKGALETHSADRTSSHSKETIASIDKKIDRMSVWVNINKDSKFYLGGNTLKKDFLYVKSCWNEYKEKISQNNNESVVDIQRIKCDNSLKKLTVIIENMVYLKENSVINIFYLSLAIAMIFSLLLIYMVRAHVKAQIIKNAIYDVKTKLFNKKYFLSTLKRACANARRNEQPLSLIYIEIDNLKNSKKHILRVFGGLINSTVRDCDIACRYENGQFFILLPNTEKEDASFLENRIHKLIEEHDFEVAPKPNFNFKVEEYDCAKTPKAFIEEVLKES